jgi:hypothetical protein
MAIKIKFLTESERFFTAYDYAPTTAIKIDVRNHEVREFALTTEQTAEIRRILQGALLALAFDDNSYTSIRQVAYMAECVATFSKELHDLNQYDTVFCPCYKMISDLQVKE